jgi:hypothetical protein
MEMERRSMRSRLISLARFQNKTTYMKLNWGHKIMLVFILFVALMFTLVYKCLHTNFELVTKEYYKDELVYQQVIDGTNNANKLASVTTVTAKDDRIHIALPDEMKTANVRGNVWFYCASNAENDRHFELKPDATGTQSFERKQFSAGNYLVKVQWEKSGEQFYSEQHLTVN